MVFALAAGRFDSFRSDSLCRGIICVLPRCIQAAAAACEKRIDWIVDDAGASPHFFIDEGVWSWCSFAALAWLSAGCLDFSAVLALFSAVFLHLLPIEIGYRPLCCIYRPILLWNRSISQINRPPRLCYRSLPSLPLPTFIDEKTPAYVNGRGCCSSILRFAFLLHHLCQYKHQCSSHSQKWFYTMYLLLCWQYQGWLPAFFL